jgi:flagellar assembly protein FliH
MATVLKNDRLMQSNELSQLVSFNVEDVQQRARDYLAEVQQQAVAILAQANHEAGEIRKKAYAEGFASGQGDFERQVEERSQQMSDLRCKTAIGACEATVTKISEETAVWLSSWRNATVELASKMAEKVVRRTMQDSEETLRVWLEEAIVAMRDARDLRVLVHPDDFAVAGRFLQNLAKMVPQAAQVEVLPDPAISLGGCVVRSMHGSIDQQMETQLQRLVEQLT